MNTRFQGIMLFATSLFVMLNGFRVAAAGLKSPVADSLGDAVYVAWGIGGICGILGLIRLNALGSKAVARAAGLLPMLGFACFIVGGGLRVAGFFQPGDALYDLLAAVGWIAVLAGMLVVGILTLAARVWTGWRRFVPLFAVLMLPVALAVGGAVGNMVLTSLIGWLPWLLLGYVIATAQPTVVQPQPAAA